MAAKKPTLGELIKEARTNAGLTQEKLAAKISGVSATDISKMERGELVPTQDVLKQIAKLTGVTQSSLLEAAKTAKTTSNKKTSSTTTTSSKKTASTSKTSSTAKTSSQAKETLTAAEKKMLEAYRKADSNTKKAALKVLNGESNSLLDTILGSGTPGSFADNAQSITENLVGNLVNGLLGNLGK
ncbi:MAG: helix-turn-helix transcriptional regulator [Clostridia bacterium]|nr:helix-turn-helix transcriptional regulator [Clostridia bacterium]MBR2286901.1 helix-turn-helix transcriptional regulator [Clostridia bacterium]